MKRKKWLALFPLLLALLAAFLIRAVPAGMPGVPEAQREYYQDESGVPYLSEMDSYFHLRLAREMTESGTAVMYNHRNEDPLMSQRPIGRVDQGLPAFLSVLAFYIWRFLSLFGRVSILQIARWMGPMFGSLAAVPVFFYARRRTNTAGGFTAALLTGLSLPFISHTHTGFFDTDMLLAVLPLGFLLLELRAMQKKRFRSQLVAGCCSGLLLAVLSLVWHAYYTYYWLMVLGGLLGLIPILCCWKIPRARRLAVLRGWLIPPAAGLFFVFLFRGVPGLQMLGEVFAVFRSLDAGTDAFPFGYQYTGEMQALPLLPDIDKNGFSSLLPATLSSGIGSLGGLIPCLLVLLAFPLAFLFSLRKKSSPDPESRYDMLIGTITELGVLLLWLGFGVVLMRTKRRFTEIAVLPVAVLAGLGIGFLCRLIRKPGAKSVWRLSLCAALSLGVCTAPFIGSLDMVRSVRPDVTDSMNNAMIALRETTPEETAVASWWDYGYFMQYAGRRRAIADGGSHGGQLNYFLANALLTDDPATMTGIFRMLETSSVAPVETLVSYGASQADASAYLLRIAPLDRDAASRVEPPVPLTEAQQTALLDLTHPEKKLPLRLVLSADMLTKTDAIGYFGLWDMDRMEQSGSLYWLAGSSSEVLEPGGEAVFDMQNTGIVLTARMDSDGLVTVSQEMHGSSYSLSRLCVWRNGRLVQDDDYFGSGPATVLVEENGRFAAFSCSPELCSSMWVRLYVCEDRSIPGVRRVETFYGMDIGDPCPVQRRLTVTDPASWCTQLWELDE